VYSPGTLYDVIVCVPNISLLVVDGSSGSVYYLEQGSDSYDVNMNTSVEKGRQLR